MISLVPYRKIMKPSPFLIPIKRLPYLYLEASIVGILLKPCTEGEKEKIMHS